MVPSFEVVSSSYCINSMFYWGIIGGNLHVQWLNHAKAKSKFLGLVTVLLANPFLLCSTGTWQIQGLVTRMTGKKKCLVVRSCSSYSML